MTENRNNDRGQVGVGTLIVFIAMVLVAAIASGVLINAAGLLQTKSAQASEESSEQVSNRVQVLNAVGADLDGSAETTGEVNLTAALAPSANEIDLSEATILWNGPSGSFTLTYDDTSDGDGNFSVYEIKDNNDGSPVLNERSDRLKININVTAFTSDVPSGSTVTLEITTKSGATTIVNLQFPPSVSGETTVEL